MFGVNWSCPRPTFMQIRTVAGIQHVVSDTAVGSLLRKSIVNPHILHGILINSQNSCPEINSFQTIWPGIFMAFSTGFLPVSTEFYRVSHRSPGFFAAVQLPFWKPGGSAPKHVQQFTKERTFCWKRDTFFWKIAWKKGALHSLLKMNMNEIILMGYEWDVMGH